MKFQKLDSHEDHSPDITIVVNSCDGYDDVLKIFLKCFDKFFATDKFRIVINQESSDVLKFSEIDKINRYWGYRLKELLRMIKSRYVLVLYDDFLLEGPVDYEKIAQVVSVMKNDKNVAAFYLNAASVKWHVDEPFDDYRLLSKKAKYLVNSVPAIWDRSALIKLTEDKDNPWAWEEFGSYQAKRTKYNFYSVSSQSKNIIPYAYQRGGAIYRGKWVNEVVRNIQKIHNIEIDTESRGIIKQQEIAPRSLMWKLNFLYIGFMRLRFSLFGYILEHLKKK